MGNKRRRKDKKRKQGDDSDSAAICTGDTKDTTFNNISVDSETNDNTCNISPPIWTAEFVENIQKHVPTSNDVALPSINDIGLQIVRGTLEKISSKRYKKARKNNKSTSSIKATPIQLRLWPALLNSFQSTTSQMNVVGISPTGSGKTQSYSIPIITKCVHTLLQSTKQQLKQNKSTNVHGLVLVPTRELAIQVAMELHLAAKVANKYMSKCCTKSSLNVDSLSIYGGADIDAQINTLLGKDSSDQTSSSLVVAATAGRLLDILKQTEKNVAEVAFSNLQAIVYDEADRIAINVDMANQVDEILSILKSVRTKNSTDIVSCLVSATLPDKAKDVCERWVAKPRVIIKVNSVKVGDKKQVTEQQLDTETTKTSGDNGEDAADSNKPKIPQAEEEQDKKKQNIPSSLDLSSIPSNIVQTLHVCSAHKKPKKLILTLQRIYMKKDEKSRGERFSANNRLTIVFFGQIKTVKYMSKLLIKEGLRCVELYGSLQQADREKRLLEFKAGEILFNKYVLYENECCDTKNISHIFHLIQSIRRQNAHTTRYRYSCTRYSHFKRQLCC